MTTAAFAVPLRKASRCHHLPLPGVLLQGMVNLGQDGGRVM